MQTVHENSLNNLPSDHSHIYLLTTDPPTNTSLTINPSNTTVLNGTEVTFNCTTDANPAASNYKFFHNGSHLGSSSSGVYSRNISKDGEYSCVPENMAGVGDSATVVITVVGNYNFDL